MNEIAPGSLVEATSKPLEIKVGRGLIGNVIDSLGKTIRWITDLPKGLATVSNRTSTTKSDEKTTNLRTN